MPISCHFWDCKALLVTHVNGAIASVQTFTFTFKHSLPAGLRTAQPCLYCISTVLYLYCTVVQKWVFHPTWVTCCPNKCEISVHSCVPNITFVGAEMWEYSPQNGQNFKFWALICPPGATHLHNFYKILSVSVFIGSFQCSTIRILRLFQNLKERVFLNFLEMKCQKNIENVIKVSEWLLYWLFRTHESVVVGVVISRMQL